MNTTSSSFGNYNGTWQSLKYRFLLGGGPLCIVRSSEVFFFFSSCTSRLDLVIYVVGCDLVTTLVQERNTVIE